MYFIILDLLDEEYDTTYKFITYDSNTKGIGDLPIPHDIDSLDLTDCSLFVKRL